MEDFINKGVVYNPEIDRFLEDDYFSNDGLKNGSFSLGFRNWGTDVSRNLFSLEKADYVSAPHSLKMTAQEFPCRLYYVKKDRFVRFKVLPWAFKNNVYWLGVKGPLSLKASFFYKGPKPVFYINVLPSSGMGKVLVTDFKKKYSSNWEKVEVIVNVPDYARAIGLEITLDNKDLGDSVLIDDVELALIK